MDTSRRSIENGSDQAIGADALAAAGRWRLAGAGLSFATLEIEQAGETRRVTPKAMAVLLALCRRPGETLSRDQLLDLVWPNDDPTPDVLSQAIRELRRALGEVSPATSCIQTVPRIGYRLAADPARIPEPARPSALISDAATHVTAPSGDRGGLVLRWLLLVSLLVAVLAGHLLRNPAGLRIGAAALDPSPTVELLTSSVNSERQPGLSADGQWLAYVEFDEAGQDSRIVLTAVPGGTRRVLNPAAGAREVLPQWSHTGRQLAYQSVLGDRCEIRITDLSDLEAPTTRALGSCSSDVYDPVAWAHDDQGLWIARSLDDGAPRTTRLVLRDLNGVDRALDYARDVSDWDLAPRPSPDGQWLLFRRGTQPRSDLYLVARAGGSVRRLTHLDGYVGRAAWLPDSSAAVFAYGDSNNRRLFLIDIGTARLTDLGVADADYADIATASGALVFERLRQRRTITELGIGAQADDQSAAVFNTPFAPSTGRNREAVYAADGRTVAFISNRSGSAQIWLRREHLEAPVRLTDWPALSLFDLAWSGDGRQLTVLAADDQGSVSALVLAVDDKVLIPREAARALPLPAGIRHPRLIGDGRTVAWLARGEHGWTAWILNLDDPRADATPIAGLSGLEPALQLDGVVLYFTDPVRGEIIRVEPPYRDARIVADGLPQWVTGRWRLAGGAIWYVWLDQDKRRSTLYRADFPGPLKPRPILDLGELRAHPVFEISPAADRLLIHHFDRDETDIGLLRTVSRRAR